MSVANVRYVICALEFPSHTLAVDIGGKLKYSGPEGLNNPILGCADRPKGLERDIAARTTISFMKWAEGEEDTERV